jgi:cell division protease FtsH
MGGYVGEEVYMGDTTTGVSNDLEKVASLAHSMVCSFGMNDELGKRAYGRNAQPSFLGRDLFEEKDYGNATAQHIDEEVKKLVDAAHQRAKKIITENRDKLDLIANRLIEKEIIDIEEARTLLGIPAPVKPEGTV